MGTHPIFESDFDCLTECHESPVTEPIPKVTITPLIQMVVTTITTPMAVHLPKMVSIPTTPHQVVMMGGITTPTPVIIPVETITVKPPTATKKQITLDHYCNARTSAATK